MSDTGTPRFVAHLPETAPGSASERLGELQSRHGDLSTMVRTMAGSPALLAGYLDLSKAAKRTGLDRRLSEQISIAIQAARGCDACREAHIEAARRVGVTEHDIALAQQGTASSVAAAAMVDFALQVLIEPDRICDATISGLRGHGFDDRRILDVLALVTVNFLTGTFNLTAGIPGAAEPLT